MSSSSLSASQDDGPPMMGGDLLTSVVKIFTIAAAPNFSMPWQIRKQQSSTASGFAIDLTHLSSPKSKTPAEGAAGADSNMRIVTNAHAVAYATSVLVRKHGTAKKFPARVVAVCHECDLALLDVLTGDEKLGSSSFWAGLPALRFGPTPALQDAITVVGYPTGGDNISVTTGVVSRVDITEYSHGSSGSKLLAVQIDAAINGGNSGGPAFTTGGLVAGVAFETLNDAENIGYIIPAAVVRHFLEGIDRCGARISANEGVDWDTDSPLVYKPTAPALPENKRPLMLKLFCDLGAKCQTLESTQMKEYYGLPKEYVEAGAGILVTKQLPLGCTADVLQRGDVLLSIDGTAVADDGTVVLRNSERISFTHLLHSKFAGDKIALELLRDKKVIQIEVVLTGGTPSLVAPFLWDERPRFFVHAGLVFVPLSSPFLHNTWGKSWDAKAPIRLCEQAFNGVKRYKDQESVVLAHVLAADVNIGYRGHYDRTVLRINGVDVRNLAHLVELVESEPTAPGSDGYLKIDLDFEKQIVLSGVEAESSNEEIFAQHNIPARCSEDLVQHLRKR